MKDAWMLPTPGYIILFHFDPPYKHARHCFDWALSPHERIKEHYQGKTRGPELVKQAIDNGSVIKVGRVRRGTRTDMAVLRAAGNASRLCKLCKIEKRTSWQSNHLEELLEKSITRLKEALRKSQKCCVLLCCS